MPQRQLARAGPGLPRELWGLMLIVIVIGGIYSGVFTPTEAAAVSAVYAFFIAVFVYKDLGRREVAQVLLVGQHDGDAAVHHHQRGAVLVPDDVGADPAGSRGLDHRRACRRRSS